MLRKSLIFYFIVVVFLLLGSVGFSATKLLFATCEWEPYYGSKLNNQGFYTEVTKAAFKAAGYDFEVKFVPWKRALEDSKSGKYDGLMGAYNSEERRKLFSYTDPVASAQLVFFKQKSRNIKYSSLRDLKNYKIGKLRGGVISEEFGKANYLTVVEGTTAEMNLKKLVHGRLDLMVEGKAIVQHLIATQYPGYSEVVEALDPPLTVNNLYNCISKAKYGRNAKKIAKDFNKGLKKIKKDGTYSMIMKKHGME